MEKLRAKFYGGVLIALLFVLPCCLMSCQGSEKAGEVVNDDIDTEQLVTLIPDSVATPAQLALKRKIEEIGIFKTVVKDNRFELTVDKNYFVKNNIPMRYYDFIVENIKSANKGIQELEDQGIEVDVAAQIEEEREAYKKYIEEFSKNRTSIEDFNKNYRN